MRSEDRVTVKEQELGPGARRGRFNLTEQPRNAAGDDEPRAL